MDRGINMKKLLTEWRKYLREGDEGDLEFLLSPPGETAQIGDEKGRAPSPGENAILRYRTDHGSYRYVKIVDGQIIAGLQVMSKDLWKGKEPATATIANVYTHPDFRRQGHAADLLAKAKQSFDKVLHSKDLTSVGSRWKSGVQSREQNNK